MNINKYFKKTVILTKFKKVLWYLKYTLIQNLKTSWVWKAATRAALLCNTKWVTWDFGNLKVKESKWMHAMFNSGFKYKSLKELLDFT